MKKKAFILDTPTYQSAENEQELYKQMRNKAKAYFEHSGINRGANTYFWIKACIFFALSISAYSTIFITNSVLLLTFSYIALGFGLMLLGINVGHDAAHHAVTRNPRLDNAIFQLVFAIQGLSWYLWQLRHNLSHHILPNVKDKDTDLEMGGIIILEKSDSKSWYHKYQHLYAPMVYLFASILLLGIIDFKRMLTAQHGNIKINKIPLVHWFYFFVVKSIHFLVFLIIPITLTAFSWQAILLSYFIMHLLVSIFMVFTFVISHHVTEVARAEANNTNQIEDSWVRYQIISAIDFDATKLIAKFLFGGFNLHIAHHIFPEVCHVHYPQLTIIIKETLEENGKAEWYQSTSFFKGCISHLKFLKSIGNN